MFRRSHQRTFLEETIAASAPTLGAWVSAPETVALLDKLDAAERKAKRRQLRYLNTARKAAVFATIGTVMAAVVLLPIERITGPISPWWGLLQLGFVIAALIAIWTISGRRLLDRWMQARAKAEVLRTAIFQSLMTAEPQRAADGSPALVQQLATFTACHLDYQRKYYRERGDELSIAAGAMAPMKYAGYVLVTLSVLVSVVVAIGLISQLGAALPDWLAPLAQIEIPEPARLQLGLGALSSAALSFAASWTLINQDDRNALRYHATLAQLDAAVGAGLAAAETAAREGRKADVIAFTNSVQSILTAEHAAWIAARPPKNPNAGPGPTLGASV